MKKLINKTEEEEILTLKKTCYSFLDSINGLSGLAQ